MNPRKSLPSLSCGQPANSRAFYTGNFLPYSQGSGEKCFLPGAGQLGYRGVAPSCIVRSDQLLARRDGLKSAASPGRALEGAACSWTKWLGELNGSLEGRSMFNGQGETVRGTLGEQGHPAGEMAPYSRLQGCLPGSSPVFHPRDHSIS